MSLKELTRTEAQKVWYIGYQYNHMYIHLSISDRSILYVVNHNNTLLPSFSSLAASPRGPIRTSHSGSPPIPPLLHRPLRPGNHRASTFLLAARRSVHRPGPLPAGGGVSLAGQIRRVEEAGLRELVEIPVTQKLWEAVRESGEVPGCVTTVGKWCK